MGDFCMKFIAQIVSGIVWIVGFVVSAIAKLSPLIDDSISALAGLIGIIAGLIWVSILLTKRKQGKVSLENELIENKIKTEQLKKLQSDE